MALLDEFRATLRDIFAFHGQGKGPPAIFEEGAFGMPDEQKGRGGMGEASGGGYKVQPRADNAPSPFKQ